jgi:hypothetical protein
MMPREGETIRSRWEMDPVWPVVQAAAFAPTPPRCPSAVRRRQRKHDVRKVCWCWWRVRCCPVRSREEPRQLAAEHDLVAELEKQVGVAWEGAGPEPAGHAHAVVHSEQMDEDARGRVHLWV